VYHCLEVDDAWGTHVLVKFEAYYVRPTLSLLVAWRRFYPIHRGGICCCIFMVGL